MPLGVTDSLPEGKRNTGTQNLAGPMATAGGLVFIGATTDNRFRAFDSRTGKELWTEKLDYQASAVPMTYQGKNSKQYVAIVAAVGGGPNASKGKGVFAYALPKLLSGAKFPAAMNNEDRRDFGGGREWRWGRFSLKIGQRSVGMNVRDLERNWDRGRTRSSTCQRFEARWSPMLIRLSAMTPRSTRRFIPWIFL